MSDPFELDLNDVNQRSFDPITIAGRWTYHWDATRRPYLHPVTTPAGHVLTVETPSDHWWHHGLWFTVKFVDGDNFWEEYDAFGILRYDQKPTVSERPDGRVEVAGTLRWIRPDKETVAIVEDRRWTHVPLGDDAYAIDLDTTLTPPADAVLDRTPFTTWGGYGGLTLRGPGDWHDTRLLLADGTEHDRVLGDRSSWCDLTGTVGAGGAEAPAGLALFDHPGNAWHPTPFYASTKAETYGDEGWSNFFNAAFLWDGPRTVAAGEGLRFRHRALVHDGAWSHDHLAAAYEEWVRK